MAIDMENNQSNVRITEDGLCAYLSLCVPEPIEAEYTESDLMDILSRNQIVVGIKKDVLLKILKEKSYITEHLVAKGIEPEDGKDGEFEFLFNNNVDRKPKILEDGSVDYGSMKNIECIEAGNEIVRYTPATPGKEGMDVTGRVLGCRNGRELPQIKGKGFIVSEDKRSYTAKVTGIAEYVSDRLTVTNMLLIDGDVNNITGDIDFAGDVEIKGNVITGMTVKAKGNISVNGHVEGGQLIAGKDIILKNGMQGGGRGEIQANGEVSGKFFEQATIYAKGSIKANAILNCYVMSEQEVIVSGKRGILVGGSISAIRKVEATIIGNVSEAKTKVSVGVDNEIYNHLNQVQDKLDNVIMEIKKMEAVMALLNKRLEVKPDQGMYTQKMELMRHKIAKDSTVGSLQQEIRNTRIKIENAAYAKVVVTKSIYKGTKLTINGASRILESENYNVFYVKEDGEVSCKQNF